ncbi:dihydropteroate synthase [Xylanibacillus composti]|uniref:Dihydropteroate synthase n=1 Tax=Xylanibacillus composti TaxID=1572762 RepID=A0A8J4GY84_9BACL|nr:dihydropteroate synthase [Xylanibacillus composti]GIQ67319.1 dihydropteroate synthase [Xylanibacillus composti]
MGILNVTPDSFSDGGRYNTLESAVRRAHDMVAEGADWIDVGGESTRPGATAVGLKEELNRVIPVIRALAASKLPVPISVDTYKAEVARQALEAGAHVLNDVWGGLRDPELLRVAAAYDCPIILTHNRERAVYANFVEDVCADLQRMADAAMEAGADPSRIWLDPGIGFAKSTEQNLLLMNHLSRITAMGYPVLLASSRKSMIWRTLDLPVDQIEAGTAATLVYGIMQGCAAVRVHEVGEMSKAVRMADAMLAAARHEDGHRERKR